MKKISYYLKQDKYQNISWSIFSKVIVTILYFCGDILLAQMLNVDAYGEWAYFYSIATILFWIAWFGINISSKIYVAKCDSDLDLKSKYIKTTHRLRFFVATIFLVIYLFLVPVLTKLLGHPIKYPNLKWFLFTGAFMAWSSSMNEYYKEQFLGLNKFKKIALLAAVEYGGYLLFGFMGILIFRSAAGVAVGYLLALSLSAWFGRRMLRGEYVLSIQVSKESAWQISKMVLKYALPILAISFGAVILLEMDNLMLGMLGNREDVALYSIAKKIVTKAVSVNDAYCAGVIVAFATITSKNVFEKERDYKKLIKENSILTLVITVGMCVMGPLFITLMYGSEYAFAALLLLLLVPYYIITALSHFFASIMDFQNMARQRSFYFGISIALNLILNLILIPALNSIGAALATILSVIPYTLLTFQSNLKMFKNYKENAHDIC